jgi:aldehyde:ferredoxin oxidoreductase
MDKIIRINTGTGEVCYEAIPDEYKGLGGRGLTSSIVSREVHPNAHPLGAENKLILATGLLSGTVAACSGRLSIGAKSPLTGGIKESSPGGVVAQKLARLGIMAIVVEELPADSKFKIILVNKDGATLLPADDIAGLGNYDAVRKLTEKYGDKVGYISIGQAGEMKLSAASIAVTDPENAPNRHAGRGGLGAVMGSKGIKAIIIDDAGADKIDVGSRDEFVKFNKMWVKAVMDNPATGQGMPALGSPVAVSIMNKEGAFPTRNFRSGEFEGAREISAKVLANNIKERGAKATLPCSPGCVIRCSRNYIGPKAEDWGKAPEYETVWAFGGNLAINDFDVIAECNWMCNDFGVDTVDTGVALGMVMEAGIIEFGDGPGALKLMREIGKCSYLGRILGSGAAVTARVLGVNRVPVVKGQAMVAYDPRVIKGMGVTESMSTMGADHGAGYMVGPNLGWTPGWKYIPKLQTEGQVDASREIQQFQTMMDCTGLCQFAHTPMLDSAEGFEGVVGMLNTMYGLGWKREDFISKGATLLKMERQFNLDAGLSPSTDRLPLFFYKEPVPPLNSVFDIPDEEMAKFYNF